MTVLYRRYTDIRMLSTFVRWVSTAYSLLTHLRP